MGFEPNQAGAIGIIGGADGPTAIFLSSKLAPNLMGAIAVSAYSYMALVPIIQPPFMRLLTTQKERLIRMKPPRAVSSTEKIVFPIVGLLLTCFLVPSGLPLLGMPVSYTHLADRQIASWRCRRLEHCIPSPEIDMQRSDRTLHAGKIRNNGQLRIDNYLMLFNCQFSIVNCQLNKFISNNKSIVQ